MKPTDAIVLENVFPGINVCSVRKGYSQAFSGGSVTPVQSLVTYHASNGTEKLFAFKSGRIYQCGTSTLNSVYTTGITVNKWQSVNFTNSAGQWALAANGTDYQLRYNGTNWSVNAFASLPSSGKTIINLFSFKERVFMIEKSTLNLWYLASQAISGTVTKLPLGGVFEKGGALVAGGSFSFDAGAGIDDYLVAVTDNGEVAIYSGITPASDFALKGVYEIGIPPSGNRSIARVAGDVIAITTKGALPLSLMINNDRAKADDVAITAKIAPKFNASVQTYTANFGWQAFVYPKGGYALFNVPVAEGSSQYQWVQNVITGAWCKFTGWNANCFGLYNDELYYGGNDGKVYKADTGRQDNGGQINYELKSAFNYCGSPGQNKLFTAMRSLLLMGGIGAVSSGVDVDFGDTAPPALTITSPGTVWVWGSGTWGNVVWGGSGIVTNPWVGVGKIGACVAVHLKGTANSIAVDINGFDVLYQKTKGQVF